MKWTVCDDDICELSNRNVCLVRANESNETVETREERRASRRRRRIRWIKTSEGADAALSLSVWTKSRNHLNP
jgi:chloramphenicol 3-O-phosphotransferase